MATFNITIKTQHSEEKKTIKACSLTAAKVQATVAFNSLNADLGRIIIADENGVKLSHKMIEGGRGKWEDVAPGKEQEEVAQAADEKIEYVVAFTLRENGENCTATVKAKDLHFAKYEASCLQDAAHGKWEDNVAVLNKDGVKLADRQRIRGLLTWRDCEQVQAKEVDAEKTGFAIVDTIPNQGGATLSSTCRAESLCMLLVGQNPECKILLDSNITSKVKVSKEVGCSVVHTISNEICDNSYLISNFAALQVLRWWTSEDAQSVGFINTKNNYLIIVTESEARWLDEKFFPLTKAVKQ